MAAMALIALLGQPALAQPAGPIELQCQLGDQPWQPCQMVVASNGMQWRLALPGQAFLFRHDGRGVVTMRSGSHGWRSVQAQWRADASLCWNGVCAKGAIPLD
jgi:hypothetical protein